MRKKNTAKKSIQLTILILTAVGIALGIASRLGLIEDSKKTEPNGSTTVHSPSIKIDNEINIGKEEASPKTNRIIRSRDTVTNDQILNFEIRGRIVGADEEPISMAEVRVEGHSASTLSDSTGNFVLSINFKKPSFVNQQIKIWFSKGKLSAYYFVNPSQSNFGKTFLLN